MAPLNTCSGVPHLAPLCGCVLHKSTTNSQCPSISHLPPPPAACCQSRMSSLLPPASMAATGRTTAPWPARHPPPPQQQPCPRRWPAAAAPAAGPRAAPGRPFRSSVEAPHRSMHACMHACIPPLTDRHTPSPPCVVHSRTLHVPSPPMCPPHPPPSPFFLLCLSSLSLHTGATSAAAPLQPLQTLYGPSSWLHESSLLPPSIHTSPHACLQPPTLLFLLSSYLEHCLTPAGSVRCHGAAYSAPAAAATPVSPVLTLPSS